MSHKKLKKNSDKQQQFDFCDICRLNHNQGRRHNYFPSHKTSLANLLTRFHSKLSDVKFFLKTPTPIRPGLSHQNRFWCIFCNCDILELDHHFACGNAIQHLASEEHWKRIKGFMWKYGGGMNRVDMFRFSEADYAKWEKKCQTLNTEAAKAESIEPVVGPSKNIQNEMHTDYLNSFQKIDFDSCSSVILNGVVPLHGYTNERTQVLCSVSSIPNAGPSNNVLGSMQMQHAQYPKDYMDNPHCSTYCSRKRSSYGYLSYGDVDSGVRIANGENSSPGLMNLTRISCTSKEGMEGNVHSGAAPPWFDATNANQLDDSWKIEERNLFAPKPRKSSKLNPKRVGAAWAERRKLEMELERRGELVRNNYDANWLPDFGRVWQSGPRKESRKEFQVESKASPKANGQTEMGMAVQPYIGKQMRGDK